MTKSSTPLSLSFSLSPKEGKREKAKRPLYLEDSQHPKPKTSPKAVNGFLVLSEYTNLQQLLCWGEGVTTNPFSVVYELPHFLFVAMNVRPKKEEIIDD